MMKYLILFSFILTCCSSDRNEIVVYDRFVVNIPDKYRSIDRAEFINLSGIRVDNIEYYFTDSNVLIYFNNDSLSSEHTVVDFEKIFLQESDLYNRKENQRNFNFLLHESNNDSFSAMFTSQYLGNTIFNYYYYFELDNILYGFSYSNQGEHINWKEDSVLAIRIKESIKEIR